MTTESHLTDEQISREEDVLSSSTAEERALLSSNNGGNGVQNLFNKNTFLFGSLGGNRNRSSINNRDYRDTRCKYLNRINQNNEN